MRIEQIIKLAKEAAEGKDDIKKGAVGSNGYGFVFKDLDSNPEEPFITSYGSHMFCGVGAYRDQMKKLRKKLKNVSKFDGFSNLLRYDPKMDLLIVGSLKTLVPDLQIGGIETFFEVWMYVMTPLGQMFPAIFYWGKSGLSIGAWSNSSNLFMTEMSPFEEFPELKSYNPFEFKGDEKDLFLDAFEFALKKVPISDFWGIFTYELGHSLMSVKKGRPFVQNWKWGYFKRNKEAEKKLKPLLDKEFKDEYNESFFIKLLPKMGKYFKIYIMEFEYAHEGIERVFGNAKKMLELCKDFRKPKSKL